MSDISVLVSGVGRGEYPGVENMGMAAARHIEAAPDMTLLPYALSGRNSGRSTVRIGNTDVELIHPDDAEERLGELIVPGQRIIAAVYSKPPEETYRNIELLVRQPGLAGLIVGATGLEEPKIAGAIGNSDVPGVIGPNMGIQIVYVQLVMESLSEREEYKGKFSQGYALDIRESHQCADPDLRSTINPVRTFSGKADTSGTAKAMVEYFRRMGFDFSVSNITKIRTWAEQQELGVPESARYGHGWHTYTLTADDAGKFSLLESLYDEISSKLLRGGAALFIDYKAEFPKNGLRLCSGDGTVELKLVLGPEERKLAITHNVNGRDIYGLGNLGAIRYLSDGPAKRESTMIDVLNAKMAA